MATYGIDLYGSAYFGGSNSNSSEAGSFHAEARSYSTIMLSWVAPEAKTWDYARVTRSRAGFPTTVFEGDEVFFTLSTDPTARNPAAVPVDPVWPQRQNVVEFGDVMTFLDSGLSGGWYYYSLFIHNADTDAWERATTTSAMVPFDYGSTDRIWNLIPKFYRSIEDNTAGYSTVLGQINPAIYLTRDRVADNDVLLQWLSVFGWGMDLIRSQTDSILDGSDPSRMHMSRLSLMAEQLGSTLENSVPAHHNRSLVRNMSLLYRQRGTESGLQEMLRLATGWEVEVTLGPNEVLSLDQGEFASPVVPDWEANRMWEYQDIVRGSDGKYYQALQDNINVPPPNATYWIATVFPSSFRNTLSKYDEIGSWRRYLGLNADPGRTYLAMGIPDPADPARNANALSTYADGGVNLTAKTEFSLASVPLQNADVPGTLTSPDGRQAVIESGIPIPEPLAWNSQMVYEPGTIVSYMGVPYEAKTLTSSVPDGSTQWKQLGYDSRLLIGVSMFVHGPFDGAAGGGMTAKPVVFFFDKHGKELNQSRYTLDQAGYGTVMYDSFLGSKPLDTVANNGRTTSLGGFNWTANAGPQWRTGRAADGGFAYPSGSALSYASIAGLPQTTGWIGVTFRSMPRGTREIGLLMRRSDASNYMAITNLGVYKTVAGTRTGIQAFATDTWQAGDRMQVQYFNNAFVVWRYRNGVSTQIATINDSFNGATTNTYGVIAW